MPTMFEINSFFVADTSCIFEKLFWFVIVSMKDSIVDTIETKVDEETTKEEDEGKQSKGKKSKRESGKKGKEAEAVALETVERKRKNAVAKDISQEENEESE